MDEAKKMVPSKVVALGPRPGSLPKPSQASAKAVAPKPSARGNTGKAVEKVVEKPEDAHAQDLEAKLTREIEAKLRRELETKLAREIEARLLQELEAKLSKAAKESEKASPSEASEVGAEMIVGESTAIAPNPFGASDDAADTIPYESSREAPAPYASPRQPASGKVSPGVNSRPAHTPTGMARASLSGPYGKTSPGVNANGSRGGLASSSMAHSHPSLRTSVSAPSRPALTPTKLPVIAPGPLPGSTKPSLTPNGTPRLAGAYASVGQAARPSVTPTSAPRPNMPSAEEMETPAAQIPAVTPTSIPTGPIYAALSQPQAEIAAEPTQVTAPAPRNSRGRMRQRDTDDPHGLYTATPTMQIRTARRVSLEDVAPDKLLGPAGDVDDRLLKSAGVPRSSRLLGLVLLLFLLLGGSSFAVYYAMAQKVPNPPHIHTAHAAQAGLARGLVEFEGKNSALALAELSQPPSLLLINGKPPKAPKPAPAPSPAPKAAPNVETPAPKPAPTPAPEPPKPPAAPPKIKIIPR
jgi:hypothetical protein